MAHPRLQILVRSTKTHQSVRTVPVLPIPGVPGHPTDPVAAYHHLLTSSPTISADQPLLTYIHQGRIHSHSPQAVLSPVCSTTSLWSRHWAFFSYSLQRGGAMAAYRQGLDHIHIRQQELWSSDTFWQYVTSSCAATSLVAAALPVAIQATAHTTSTHSFSAS